MDILANQPLVVDNGTSCLRAGIAGDSVPTTVAPAYVGRPKHDRAMIGSLEGSAFVGDVAEAHRGLLTLRYAMRHGVVESWSDMELIWQHMYAPKPASGDKGLNSEDHPVLITEPPLNPKRQRETAAQILFETFNVPAAYFAVPAVLSLYAAGKTSGLVLDVGDGVAHCVPVYQGFSITSAIRRSDMASGDVTDYLQLLLRKQGIKLMTSAEREVVKRIKELHSNVQPETVQARSSNDPALTAAAENAEPITYKLPDGQKLKLERLELARAPEPLFRPHIFGSEESAVHELVATAIARSDLDLRATLYQTIVLSGGGTQVRGFGDRLLNELKQTAPASTKLRIIAPPNRSQTTWIGGSILAGLSTFRKMWVTADEYEEQPSRIHLQ